MKKDYLLGLFFLCFMQTCLLLKAQERVEEIIKPLEAWADMFPQEKIYVHTDKPYYMAGDTIWFKTYTVAGAQHRLSSLSGAIYVDLISSTDSVVSSLKLPLMAGMSKGSIDLPVALKSGNYRLRAYTQWMRNTADAYFYDRPFFIGAINQEQIQTHAILMRSEDKSKIGRIQITYQDVNGSPLANKGIDYMVRTGATMLSQRKTKTDEQGVLEIPLDDDVLQDSASAFIVSDIRMEKNKTLTHVFPIQVKYNAADVQFFPESGSLVDGLPCRVAFKVVGVDGLGVDAKGVLLDQDQQTLAEFNTAHLGMGQFTFTPDATKKYEAQITFPDGSFKKYPLPAVEDSGYVLSIYPQVSSDTALLRLMASPDKLKHPISIVAQMDGAVLYAADLDLNKSLNSLYVPMQQDVSGVVQFTLFDNGQALNERIVYIEKPDTLHVQLKGVQAEQAPRSEQVIDLMVLDKERNPLSGNLSVAVRDETRVPSKEEDENAILPQLLLQSNIAGYIEKPNYYFTEVTDEKRDHLDLLMMTQGYRKFVWQDILTGKLEKPTYPVEKVVSSISGKLLTLRNGKPVANGKITLFSAGANIALDTITNEEGRFVFDNLFLTDNIQFTIQGRSEKGSDKVEILLDGIPSLGVTPNKNTADFSLNVNQKIDTYFEQTKKYDGELAALGLESRLIQLNEVLVTAKVEKKLPTSYNLNGAGRADQVISGAELGTCPTLRMCLEGRLRGVVFRSENTSIGPITFPTSTREGRMQFFIDGRQLRYDSDGDLMDLVGILEQNLIDPTQIFSIEVLRSPHLTNMYGPGARAGVILINTKGWSPSERTDYSAKLYTPKGFSTVREFYSPKYGVSERMDVLADQRTTVYWSPAVPVGKDGKATISYFNTGNPGIYKITIEGIGSNGQLTRKVIKYQLK